MNWIINNKLYFLGALSGAVAGLLYWKFVGCITGTCAITSSPINSSIYFAILGALFFSLFKKGRSKPTSAKAPVSEGEMTEQDIVNTNRRKDKL
jgi:hypothetical protein